MPSKRHSTAVETREPSGSRRPGEHAPETPAPAAVRPARPSRGAAVHPAPRKAELHHVALAPRPPPTQEQIACRAYEIWLQTGCVPGRDAENWARAELELLAGSGPGSSA